MLSEVEYNEGNAQEQIRVVLGLTGTIFAHEVAFPYHQAIVLCHFGGKERRLYVSAQCMTKSNMFIRECLTC